MDQFNGKIAVITGAGSGIGRALAKRCAAEGMQVAAADVNPDRLESLEAQLAGGGCKVMTQVLDVSDASAFSAFGERCRSEFGAPDLLFNNAGILRLGDTWSHSADDWQKLFSINIMGVVNGVNAFVPFMLEEGRPAHIVNTGYYRVSGA